MMNARKRSDSSGFVVDGHQRALEGIEKSIRPQIESRYSEELKSAGFLKRWLLARRIEREVKIQAAQKAKPISPYSLY